MIIIGLLIGGTLSGMQLLQNSKVQRTVQDLKSFDAAGLIFKDTYRALPGDIRAPNTKLPNCTTAPCSRAGDGNRIIGIDNTSILTEALDVNSEKFTFWNHLSAAGLITGIRNEDNMNFGVGQPQSPLGGGYRFSGNAALIGVNLRRHHLYITKVTSIAANMAIPSIVTDHRSYTCDIVSAVDRKADDGLPRGGNLVSNVNCLTNPADWTLGYANPNSLTSIFYYLKY